MAVLGSLRREVVRLSRRSSGKREREREGMGGFWSVRSSSFPFVKRRQKAALKLGRLFNDL